MKKRIPLFLVALAMIVLLAGCLPGELRKQAEGLSTQITTTTKSVAAKKEQYANLEKSADFKDLAVYAKRENWADNFTQAESKIKDAQKVYDGKIKTILDDNKSEQEIELRQQIHRVNVLLEESLRVAGATNDRIQFLTKVMKEAPAMVESSKGQMDAMLAVLTPLQQYVKQAQTSYPSKVTDLSTKLSKATNTYNESLKSSGIIKAQFASKKPDYAVLGDCCNAVCGNLGAMRTEDQQIRGKIAELGKSYSKTLTDMRVEYYVTIGRTSWYEGESDWPTETDYSYPQVQVDEATFNYFDTIPEDDDYVLATHSNGWFSGDDVKINGNMWSRLHISYEQNWPDGDNDAEYWLKDATACYQHQYIVTENGVQRTTGWETVSESFFDQHEDDLGMDIVVKPYGMYEEETIKTATPPGLAYVGNSKYGHWQGSGSNQFWVWYGQWSMMNNLLGGNRYYYNDYNDWNRNYRTSGRPYYGTTKDGDDRFGSYSSTARQRYAGSNWVRTGGIRDDETSVRNAGPSARGGGPGGGGK